MRVILVIAMANLTMSAALGYVNCGPARPNYDRGYDYGDYDYDPGSYVPSCKDAPDPPTCSVACVAPEYCVATDTCEELPTCSPACAWPDLCTATDTCIPQPTCGACEPLVQVCDLIDGTCVDTCYPPCDTAAGELCIGTSCKGCSPACDELAGEQCYHETETCVDCSACDLSIGEVCDRSDGSCRCDGGCIAPKICNPVTQGCMNPPATCAAPCPAGEHCVGTYCAAEVPCGCSAGQICE